jgi:hypothetical protein
MTQRSTQPFIYRDNTGGCNLLANEAHVNQTQQATEMVYLQNLEIYKEGGFSSQLGNLQLNSGVTDTSAVTSIGQYKLGNLTYIMYTKSSGKAYSIALNGGAEGSPIKIGLSGSAVSKFVEYNSKVVAFNGVNNPWEWDSASATDLTNLPTDWTTIKPTTADTDGGRRIFAVAGPNIYYCSLGNENDWTTSNDAGQLSDVFNDNTNIIALTNYGDNIAFHSGKPGIYLLSGTSPATYAIKKIASNRACVSKLGVATAADYQYFFSGDAILPIITTDLGVIRLGKEYDISRKIKPFINATDTELPLLPLDQTAKNTAILLPYDFKNQLVCFFKTSGSPVYDTQAIYNFDQNAWTFRVATPATAAARVGDNIIIGTSDGRIIQEYFGTKIVAGNFLKRILSPYFDFGTPNNQKQIIKFYLVCKSNTNLNVTFNLYTDYQSGIKYTQDITSVGISGSTYGAARYGISTYASTQIFDLSFDVNLQAKRFQFEILGSDANLDFRIIYYGFEIDTLDAY